MNGAKCYGGNLNTGGPVACSSRNNVEKMLSETYSHLNILPIHYLKALINFLIPRRGTYMYDTKEANAPPPLNETLLHVYTCTAQWRFATC